MTTSGDDPAPDELPDHGSAPRPPTDPTPREPRTAPPVNQKALWSMVIGFASLAGVCCVFGGFVGIAAIVLGVVGRAEVLQSGGSRSGEGMAVAGIVTGAIAELGSIVMVLIMAFD